MYEELLKSLEQQLSCEDFEKIKNHTLHLGIFSEPYLTYMLEGKKTIESRFSKNKIAPYNQIETDDIVIVKKSGGDIIAYFTIKEILFFKLNEKVIDEIKIKYNKQLCVDENFWNMKKNSNYATILFIDKIVKLKPFPIHKKRMQTWVKLHKRENGNCI